MWQPKQWKEAARKTLRANYGRIVAVCVLAGLLAGGLSFPAPAGTAGAEPGAGGQLQAGRPVGKSNAQILEEFLENTPAGQALEKAQASPGQGRGVLSRLVNDITASGSFLFGALNAVNQMAFQGRAGAGTVIALGALLTFCWWVFVGGVLPVGERRFFLESRVYRGTRFHRVFLPYRVHRTRHTAFVMLVRDVKLCLWALTIVGLPVKLYAYAMVPYILAENPAAPCGEAFRLSARMMKGRKWRRFLLDASFIGWYVLNVFTLGLLDILFISPYRKAVYAEVYMALRSEARSRAFQGAQWLCDTLLEAVPCEGEYPAGKYILPEAEGRRWLQVDYHCNYSMQTLVLLFFTFSFLGWVWEVGLHLFGSGVFVNRGVLHGPWLPIYGTGGVLLLVLLKKVRDNPLATFLLGMVVCGVVEYSTAWYLETFKHTKWWDYSGYFLNLHGRICAEGLLVFGLGGCMFIYVLGPLLNNLYAKVPGRVKTVVCTALLAVFLLDFTYSSFVPNTGKGITDYPAPTLPPNQ